LEVSGQPHAPAIFLQPKQALLPIGQQAGWHGKIKRYYPSWDSNSNLSAAQEIRLLDRGITTLTVTDIGPILT
jgi:hypothetical protein